MRSYCVCELYHRTLSRKNLYIESKVFNFGIYKPHYKNASNFFSESMIKYYTANRGIKVLCAHSARNVGIQVNFCQFCAQTSVWIIRNYDVDDDHVYHAMRIISIFYINFTVERVITKALARIRTSVIGLNLIDLIVLATLY